MKKIFYVTMVLFLIATTGCKKEKAKEQDVPATIEFTSPSALAIYINGSTVKVTGNMADNNVLASASVEIKVKSTNAVLYSNTIPTGNVGYFQFDWQWLVTGITANTKVVVKVTAKDKLGNEVSKELETTLDS